MAKAAIDSTTYLQEVLALSQTNPFYIATAKTFRGIYIDVVKLELWKRGQLDEKPILDEDRLTAALARIDNWQDMSDFILPAFIRILKEYRDLIEPDQIARIEKSLLGFRYWLDEGGDVNAAYFTENHQVLFHGAEYVIGDMFPDSIFWNQQTGAWHKQRATEFLTRWLRWRNRFGFCEWTSRYSSENLLGLSTLLMYCDNQNIVNNSDALIKTIMFEIAMYSFRGVWSGTSGRIYANFLVEPEFQAQTALAYMYWGEGSPCLDMSDTAIMFAVYDYTPPSVISELALDPSPEIISKMQISLFAKEGAELGVDPADFDNIMLYWGIQVYDAYEVIENSAKVMPPSNWMNERINAFLEAYRLYAEAGITDFNRDPDFTAMTRANLYFYKTPDYAISCAQDFRRGSYGYQQHPWGANLGGRAIVFTNHSASIEYNDRPNMIAGNGVIPRAVQAENVVLCIYRIPPEPNQRFLETHAYFPRHEFDEVVETKGWLFGRKGLAYIAIKSLVPTFWKTKEPDLFQAVYPGNWEPYYERAEDYYYHANGHANVWACEMGSEAQNGSFTSFMNAFSENALTGDTFEFTYLSPSHGEMRFGWDAPLTVLADVTGEPETIQLSGYKRFDNPYAQAELDDKVITVSYNENSTVIDMRWIHQFTRYDEEDPRIVYHGQWSRIGGPNYYRGSQHYTLYVGDDAEFTFEGTAFNILAATRPDSMNSLMEIFVDGTLVGTCGFYSEGYIYIQTVYESPELEWGIHNIRLRNAQSSIYIDAIDIKGELLNPQA